MTFAELSWEAFELSKFWGSNWEMLAVITGVLCVGLITFENRSKALAWWNWPIGAVSSAIFVYVFWQYELYFNSVLQIGYVLMAFWGAYAWKWGESRLPYRPVSSLRWYYLAGGAVLALAWAWALSATLFNWWGVESAAPFWDALVVTLSLTAQILMTFKWRQHWYFWMAVDVIGVVLFASQGLYATSLLYFIYGCLVVRGMVTWKQAEREDNLTNHLLAMKETQDAEQASHVKLVELKPSDVDFFTDDIIPNLGEVRNTKADWDISLKEPYDWAKETPDEHDLVWHDVDAPIYVGDLGPGESKTITIPADQAAKLGLIADDLEET